MRESRDHTAPLARTLAEQRARLSTRLRTFPDVLARFPIEAAVRSLDSHAASYKTVPPSLIQASQAIERDRGRDAAETYHQLLLVSLMERFCALDQGRSYPDGISSLFAKHFASIVRRIEQPLEGYFVRGSDGFTKDLGVCSQRLIPCGAQLVDRNSGVPRRTIFQGGPRQVFSMPAFMTTRLGGFHPLYEMHMDARLLLDFNPRGWRACYQRIAALLQTDNRIRGVCGASWWFDPQLAQVSPRLAFLRELPAQHGARFFRVDLDSASVGDATLNSPQRKALFDAGKYFPARYLLVWSRQDLLAWSSAQPRDHAD